MIIADVLYPQTPKYDIYGNIIGSSALQGGDMGFGIYAAENQPIAVHAGEDQWVCEAWTCINSIDKYTCFTCGYRNMAIKMLKYQNKIARMGYNKYWPTWKSMFNGADCPQCSENAVIYNALYNQVQNEYR